MKLVKVLRFLSLVPILANIAFVQQTNEIVFSKVVIDYKFDEKVTFEAYVTPDHLLDQIERIEIYIYPNQDLPIVENVNFDPGGLIQFTFPISEKQWEPFIQVVFLFHVTFQNGQEHFSDKFSFQYDDNRLEWNRISSPPFTVYWHSDDSLLGQMVLKTAFSGLQSAQEITGAVLQENVCIYVYSDLEYLRTALHLEDLTRLAAHAAKDRHVIILSAVPGPGLQLELERQLPHEIAHLLTNSMSGDRYDLLPHWLVEGIATISEIYPNSDYQRVLNTAAANGNLIPMQSLCEAFPENSSAAFLSYAQSGSFVNFLYKRYGPSGLNKLVMQYSTGVSCSSGIAEVFGETFNELEYRWQQEVLGIDSELLVFQNLSPYLVILFALLLMPMTPFLFKRKKALFNK